MAVIAVGRNDKRNSKEKGYSNCLTGSLNSLFFVSRCSDSPNEISKCSDYSYTWIVNMRDGISTWDDGVMGFHHN